MDTVATAAGQVLTAEDCFDRLAQALAAVATKELEKLAEYDRLERRFETAVEADNPVLGPSVWRRHQLSWRWLAPLTLPFSVNRIAVEARLDWPAGLSEGDVPLPRGRESEISLGGHTGLFLDRPMVASHGFRLREGLHFIPRPVNGGKKWAVDVVFAPTLGRDLRLKVRADKDPLKVQADKDPLKVRADKDPWAELGNLLASGARRGRYVSPELVSTTLAGLNIASGEVDEADVSAAVWAQYRSLTGNAGAIASIDLGKMPRRTAESRNRMVGSDEAMAELVLGFFSKLTNLARKQVEPLSATVWAGRFAARIAQAGEAALAALSAGRENVRSVVAPLESGMTLARIEQEARRSFGGFRGLGIVRGRADLRDLEAGWRNLLCPVQTPEAEDIGLVRYAALGTREDAWDAAETDDRLSEWLDLSASAGLIPFINHDDPARASIGSKNLKQAVPVERCELPLVYTGWETVLGLAAGTARVPSEITTATVTRVGHGFVTVSANGSETTIRFGMPDLGRSGVENRWVCDVEVGDSVTAGAIVAHAPDVRVHDQGAGGRADAELCLGVNALVALTPWHGLNHEDGIVVSESFAAKMTSSHFVKMEVPAPPGECYLDWPMVGGQARNPRVGLPWAVEQGEVLVEVVTDRDRKVIRAPEPGEVDVKRNKNRGTLDFIQLVQRPLAVGDKLSNRHQGKGVVSAILPEVEMPVIAGGPLEGRPIDVILNPVGVLRRLNIGQLWEMHYGLEAMLREPDAPQRIRVGRRATDPKGLANRLADPALQAPLGRLQLKLRDGSPVGGVDGVVVGPQYIVKLNHLASAKISARGDDPARSTASGQPTQHSRYDQDHWVGSAQRLGEMEVWALEAAGADAVLADALQERSATPKWARERPRASLRSIQAHLAVAGLELTVNGQVAGPLQQASRDDIDRLAVRWRPSVGPYREPSGREHVVLTQLEDTLDWRALWPTTTVRQQWLGWPGCRPGKFDLLKRMVEGGQDDAAISAAIGARPADLPDWRDADPEFRKLFADRQPPPAGSQPESTASDAPVADSTRGLDVLYSIPDERTPGDGEIVRWAIPLPRAVEHPWGADLPWIRSVPILPPAYRMRNPSGPRGLDRLYLELAGRLVAFEAQQLAKASQADAYNSVQWKKVRDAVYAILGRPKGEDRIPRVRAKGVRDKDKGVGADSIYARLGGKRGLLRRYLLGQATVFSGRSVMVPTWQLGPDEVGLPLSMLRAFGLPHSEDDVDKAADLDRVVLVNRQPSLHPYSVVALKYRPVAGDAIRLHPLVLKGLAGDFDGDTIAVHRPTSSDARQNAWDTLSPEARLRSSANGRVLAKFDLDILLGLYLGRNDAELHKGLPALPDQLPAWDGIGESTDPTFPTALSSAIDEQVRRLLVEGANQGPRAALRTLAKLEKFGVDRATGWSIGALELLAGPDAVHFCEAVAADVGGKASARQQLLVRRGEVKGAHPGNATPDVADNFLFGLRTDDYFGTAPGAIASLAVKKLMTPEAGALTKTLVEIADPVAISSDACRLHSDPAFKDVEKSPLTCVAEAGICQACYGLDPGTERAPVLGARVGVLAATLIGERSTELSMKAFHGGGSGGSAVEGSIDELQAVFGQGTSKGLAFTKRRTPKSLEDFLNHVDPLPQPPVLAADEEPSLTADEEARLIDGVKDLPPDRREDVLKQRRDELEEKKKAKALTQKRRTLQRARSVEALTDPKTRSGVLAPVVSHAVKTLKGDVDAVHVKVLLRQLLDTWFKLDDLREAAPEGQASLVALAQRRGRSGFELATSRGRISWLLMADPDESSGGVRSSLVAGNLNRAQSDTDTAEPEAGS